MRAKRSSAAFVAASCLVLGCNRTSLHMAHTAPDRAARPVETANGTGGAASRWTTAVDPKPISPGVRKGLDWIVEHQHVDGGWSQGEEAQQMGGSMDGVRDRPNVADTCIAALALVRSGDAFGEGRYGGALERALQFVCGKVEASDADSLSVTDVMGTRVQAKIGTYVDTFLASMLLSEVKGRLADADLARRAEAALEKVIGKIEKNQQANGTWDNQGWAPVLSQSLAGRGLNLAAQSGVDVDRKTFEATALSLDDPTGPASQGAAGVSLYSLSSNLGVLQNSVNTGDARERELRDKLEKSQDEGERRETADELSKIEVFRRACAQSQDSVVGRLDDPAFVSGFGSNGGEEFLSYMNISESLVLRGGEDWTRWDQGLAANMGRVQNEDGSWSGHHCITGRTFCTSAALLTLMADRTPVPVESKEGG